MMPVTPALLPILATAFITTAMPPDADTRTAPRISNLMVDPDSGSAGTRYVITLRITDPQGVEDIEKTLYQLRERTEAIPLPLNDAGQHGDHRAGDGIYTAADIVPRTAGQGTHTFEVFVQDRGGHRSNILEYRFTVVDGAMVQVR